MSGKILARASAVSLVLVLAACGGDDSSSKLVGTDNQSGGSDGTDTPEGVTVGSLSISASPVQIGTTSNAESEILVYVRDEDNILVPDVPVQFSGSAGSSLQVEREITDASGSALASLRPLNDPRNRIATVSASAGNQESSISIAISGTTLSLDGPSAVSAGNSATFTASLADSANEGIPLETIAITNSNPNNSISFSTNTTGDSGEIQFTLDANSSGSDTITASAFSGDLTTSTTISVSDNSFRFSTPSVDQEIPLNTPANVTLQWTAGGAGIATESISFASTRGTLSNPTAITDGNGNATISIQGDTAGPATIVANATDPDTNVSISTQQTVEFVATTPALVTAQASKTQLIANEQSRITAVVRDSAGNLVKNKIVEFKIESDVSGGVLSSATGTTDSLGRSSVTYTAGQSSTGRDGVIISTKVKNTAISDDIALTVSNGALRLTVGTGNTLAEPDADHYVKDWVVFVSDANGQPVEGADVELSVTPVAYRKGNFILIDEDDDGEYDYWAADNEFSCPSEDLNGNGILDVSESDTNNSGNIEPTNDAVAVVDDNITASDGSAHFDIRYAQSSCAWVDVKVEARTSVDGTEYGEEATITLPCAASDLQDPEVTPPAESTADTTFGVEGKYGNVLSCSIND
ncbi:Ig-like domain-containing protein [Marinobacter sp. F3R08]|uniref:Ig-like domain-containing protein n=1 Tax=Marinobacter sp. F3R08 TaxID=2841559 RepID=UPI001C0894A2|nr:Ig-like domain-containing protein [Marinobacter sp. F3R08]MBU2952397.1 Ig-like domain-containing protein [Marinobacter sp. F3R08]